MSIEVIVIKGKEIVFIDEISFGFPLDISGHRREKEAEIDR